MLVFANLMDKEDIVLVTFPNLTNNIENLLLLYILASVN